MVMKKKGTATRKRTSTRRKSPVSVQVLRGEVWMATTITAAAARKKSMAARRLEALIAAPSPAR